jgi:hypothetical protein
MQARAAPAAPRRCGGRAQELLQEALQASEGEVRRLQRLVDGREFTDKVPLKLSPPPFPSVPSGHAASLTPY